MLNPSTTLLGNDYNFRSNIVSHTHKVDLNNQTKIQISACISYT